MSLRDRKYELLVAKQHKKLLGAWQSNRKRTMADLSKQKDFTPKQLKFLRNLFGKMKVWWRPKTVINELNGPKKSGKYEVLGADSSSIVLLTESSPILKMRPQIVQIHFDDDGYWLLSGKAHEYFKRIE